MQDAKRKRYTGKYKGIVVDARDPEFRNRYRVHVYLVHQFLGKKSAENPDSPGSYTEQQRWHPLNYDVQELINQGVGGPYIKTGHENDFTHLPWAEVCAFTIKGGGFTPIFEVGDLVYVEFENGDQQEPVIVGGLTSNSFGEPDLIPEKYPCAVASSAETGDYADFWNYAAMRYRWTINSREGGMVELADIPDEAGARISVGNADFIGDRNNDSYIFEGRGFLYVDMPTFMFMGQNYFAVSETELILQVMSLPDTGNTDGRTLPWVNPMLGLYSSWDVDIYGKDEIAIGQYLMRDSTDPVSGSGSSSGGSSEYERNMRKQTRFLWLGAKNVNVGVACPDPWKQNSTYPLDRDNVDWCEANFIPTERVRVEAQKSVVMHCVGNPEDADICSASSTSTSCDDSLPVRYCSDVQDGDIVLWAKRNLVLQAEGEVILYPKTGRMVVVSIISAAEGGGKYLGVAFTNPVTDILETDNLSDGDMGMGDQPALILNLQENGLTTHKLMHPDNTHNKMFIGVVIQQRNGSCRMVVAINGLWSKVCTSGSGS
jgi:hypothetical protein